MASPFYTAEHIACRDVVRRFVEKEIEPYASQWDEAGEFPRELYAKAAAISCSLVRPGRPNYPVFIIGPRLCSTLSAGLTSR